MRELLFRGKCVGNREWLYGGYYKDNCYGNHLGERVYISTWNTYGLGFIENIQVDPNTVGQFTGLTDKNGVKIFEGDIVRIEDFVNATVKWREDIACWTLKGYIIGNTWASSMLEVIGNIHDNKELLQ